MDITILLDGNPVATDPYRCEYTRNASDRCDSLSLAFKDEDEELSGAGLLKGMELEALCGSVETGKMWISEIGWRGDAVSIRALSMPAGIVASNNAAWEKVSFDELVRDVAGETGLGVVFEDTLDVYYESVSRLEMSPLEFLQHRLMLEGFALRVKDGTVYIYDERAKESADAEVQIWLSDFSAPPVFSTSDSGLVAAVRNTCLASSGAAIDTLVESGLPGRTLRKNFAVSSIGESERFSRGIMRAANKYEFVCEGKMGSSSFTAGETVWLVDAPSGHDGLNFIYRTMDDFISDTQTAWMRKPIGGGY